MVLTLFSKTEQWFASHVCRLGEAQWTGNFPFVVSLITRATARQSDAQLQLRPPRSRSQTWSPFFSVSSQSIQLRLLTSPLTPCTLSPSKQKEQESERGHSKLQSDWPLVPGILRAFPGKRSLHMAKSGAKVR